MKHLKLFEELSIPKEDFPEDGHELNTREEEILIRLTDRSFLGRFKIRKEDNYYYTFYQAYNGYFNKLDGFNKLKDYLLCKYYSDGLFKGSSSNIGIYKDKLLDLLKVTDLDPSFENNLLIRLASGDGFEEIVRFLLKDPRVDPSDFGNEAIRMASGCGHIGVVKLLLKDPRVDPTRDAISLASIMGHKKVVKLLIKDPRVRKSLTEKEIKEYESY